MATPSAVAIPPGQPGPADLLAEAARAITETGTWWIMSAWLVIAAACLAGSLARPRAGTEPSRRSADTPTAVLLFVGALIVRALLATRIHYTYNDEYLYLRQAAEMASTGRFSLQNQPPLLIYLYALAFTVLPTSAGTSFTITTLAGSLTAPALYGCLRSLRVERSVAILAAALLALHPLHIKHSGASSLEIVSLLFVVATVGTFARWLRDPGWWPLLSFASALFAALTTRVENFVLVPALPGLALVPGLRTRRVSGRDLGVLAATTVVAMLYLPGVLLFHESQAGWWKSELGPLALLSNNLAFWIGGALATGKLPLALLVAGMIGSWRRHRQACVTWLLLGVAYSAVYVAHGANLGYHVESAHPPYFAQRAAGHDMFRFNILLLPTVVFFTASGVVASMRFVRHRLERAGVRAAAPTVAWHIHRPSPPPARPWVRASGSPSPARRKKWALGPSLNCRPSPRLGSRGDCHPPGSVRLPSQEV